MPRPSSSSALSITAATLIFGELVPKRLALHRAEQLARFVAPLMNRLVAVGRPGGLADELGHAMHC